MRRSLCVLAVLAASGCGRKFIEPPPPSEQNVALAVNPSWMSVAPNEVRTFQVAGGKPGYRLSGVVDAGPDCGVVDFDGGLFAYRACLRPFIQDTVEVTDSAGAHAELAVSIGPAFAPDTSPVIANPCEVKHLNVSGGRSPYAFYPAGPSSVPACDDGGAGLEVVAVTPTGLDYRVPAWRADAGDTYVVEVDDAIGFDGGPSAPAGSRYTFSLTVNQPPSQRAPLQPTQPWITVAPGSSIQLGYTPAEAPVRFFMPDDGNSSDGSVTADGRYTAGPNPDTIDHVQIQATDDPSQLADVYIVVGNPRIALPLTFSPEVRAGDFNGDGLSDLLLVSEGTQNLLATEVLGGAVLPAQAPSFTVPSSGQSSRPRLVEPLDVNGDGLTDMVIVGQNGRGGAQHFCSLLPPAACTTDGGDPTQNQMDCQEVGGSITCSATLYANGGFTNVPCVANGSELSCSANGAQISCELLPPPYGNGTSYSCDKGCAATANGEELCVSSWSCGAGGCVPSSTHQDCSGTSCSLFEVDGSQQSNEVTCTADAGIYDCGAFTCRPDAFGGYDCGARDCVPTASGFICNFGSCQIPDGGPTFDCEYEDGQLKCSACADAAYGAQLSNDEILQAQLDGTFRDVGELPWARGALPAVIGTGTLLVPDDAQLTARAPQGTLEFTRSSSGALGISEPVQLAQSYELAAPRDASGKPWGAFEADSVFIDGGASIEIFGVANGASFSFGPLADSSGGRARILGQVALQPNGDESLVIADYATGKLTFVDSQGNAHVLAVPLPSGSSIGQVVPLPGLGAVAVGLSTQQSPLGQPFVLFGAPVNGVPQELDWEALGLPALDQGLHQGVAAGDFNGDGLADFAVVETQSLTLYPGQVGGKFSQGDQYGESIPVGSLSTTDLGDGGRILGAGGLDGQLHLFEIIDRNTDGGELTSSLALLPSVRPAGATAGLGLILRGRQLWALPGGPELDVYADFRAPSDYAAVSLAGIDPSMSPVLASALISDASDSLAAWALFGSPDGTTIAAVHLHGQPDGSVQADAPIVASGLLEPGGFAADGADLVFASVAPNGSGYELWRSGPSGFTNTQMSPSAVAGLSFRCNRNDLAAPVPGSTLMLFNAAPGDGGCNADDSEEQLFVYDTAAQLPAPVAGARDFRIDQLALTHFADGGSEIVGISKNDPGVFGIVQGAGGSWQVDPTLLANIGAIGMLQIDSGRFALAQIQPPSIRVLHR